MISSEGYRQLILILKSHQQNVSAECVVLTEYPQTTAEYPIHRMEPVDVVENAISQHVTDKYIGLMWISCMNT